MLFETLSLLDYKSIEIREMIGVDKILIACRYPLRNLLMKMNFELCRIGMNCCCCCCCCCCC